MTQAPSEIPSRDEMDAAIQADLQDLFQLEMVYARGPVSRLYVARDVEYNQPVALKVMPRGPQAGAHAEEAFHEAAAAAAVLTHPHVTPLYSAGATDRFFWYSTEFVPGCSLADTLHTGSPMDLEACLKLADQIAAALDAAHRLGIVHADLKPTNVLLDTSGAVRVTDFWIRWVLEDLGAFGNGDVKDGLGREWPGPYLSPEQRVGREPGPAADQYALGAIIYRCLAGTPPPADDPMAAIAEGRSPMPPPRLTDARPDIPGGIGAIIERALSPAPEGRFETAGAFAAALREPTSLVEEAPHPPRDLAHGPAAVASLERPARHGVGLVSVALLAFVFVGAAGAAWILGLGLTTGQPVASQPAPQPPVVPESTAPPSAYPTVLPDSAARTASIARGAPAAPAATRAPVRRTPRPRAAPPPPRRDVSLAPGRLFISATPWGQVFVDGELIGNTPRVGAPIAPGMHRVRVVRDGFDPFERNVQVAPGQDLRLIDIVLRESRP